MYKILMFTFFILSGNIYANNQKMDNYWNEYTNYRPVMTKIFGDEHNHKHFDKLSEKDKELFKSYVNNIQLNRNEELNNQVFNWIIENEIKLIDLKTNYFTFHTVYGFHNLIPMVLSKKEIKEDRNESEYIEMLSDISRYMEENIELLNKGIKTGYVHSCSVLDNYELGIISYIPKNRKAEDSVFFNNIKNASEKTKEKAKKIIENKVFLSYENYYNFFTKKYKPNCRKNEGLVNLENGKEIYQLLSNYYTSTNIDVLDIHNYGLLEVSRILNEMDILAKKEGFKNKKDYMENLKNNKKLYAKTEEDYIDFVKRKDNLIKEKMKEYFNNIPDINLSINKIPEGLNQKSALAFYMPGSVTQSGKFFINTYKYEEQNLIDLVAVTVHEGRIGHHLQMSIQNSLKNVPLFKKSYYFHAYGEGYGLYVEKLAEEMNIYENNAEKFGRLNLEMNRALRLVVDTGIHLKGWKKNNAIKYMKDNSFLSLNNIEAEVNRFISYPAQSLSYKVGEKFIIDLRKMSENELGNEFDIKEFHDVLLNNGSLPLKILEIQIKNYIKIKKNKEK